MLSVSVVGGGPVGLMVACLLSPFYHVVVYEKRDSYKRVHELKVTDDVIDELVAYCDGSTTLSDLSTLLIKWKNSCITTMSIERELRDILGTIGVDVVKRWIVDPSELKTDIIIACDGAHSSIRRALHKYLTRDPSYNVPELVDRHLLGYMMKMSSTTSLYTTPRRLISGVVYNTPLMMNGLEVDDEWFHATSRTDFSREVSLYLPISRQLYQLLREKSWTMATLKEPSSEVNMLLLDHLSRYQINLELRGGSVMDEIIGVFPLSGYRASSVSYISNNNTNAVFLVGDASSRLTYRRGLKKGWREACYLAKQLMESATTARITNFLDLEHAAGNYQEFCTELYQQEFAIINHAKKYKNSGNSTLALTVIGVLSLAAVGLAWVLRR